MALRDKLLGSSSTNKKNKRPGLGRRTSTFLQVKESIGYRFRKVLYKIEDKLGPIVTRLIPNFVVAHYVYIIFCAIIGSILIYPVKNIRYIDALFFAAGASTQAGLNTVNVNELTLYQQIVLYVICMITTPIFIHSTITYIRLYWFEKSFDHIKEKSKQNFKMRKTATLAAFRTQTMTNTRTNSIMPNRTATMNNRNSTKTFDTHNASEDLSSRLHKFQATQGSTYEDKEQKLDDVLEGVEQTVEKTAQGSSSSHTSPDSGNNQEKYADQIELDNLEKAERGSFDPTSYNDVIHYSEPSDDEEEDEEESEDLASPIRDDHKDIKFANLPKPPSKRRNTDINPRDLYMSISMMQHKQQKNDYEDEDSGPALRIKGPAERQRHRLPGHHHRHRRHHRQRKKQEKLKVQKELQKELVDEELSELHVDGDIPRQSNTTLPIPRKFGHNESSASQSQSPSPYYSADDDDSAMSAEFDSDKDDDLSSLSDSNDEHPQAHLGIPKRQSDPGTGIDHSHVAFTQLQVPSTLSRRAVTMDHAENNNKHHREMKSSRSFDKSYKLRSHAGDKFSKLSRKLTKTKSGLRSVKSVNYSDIEDLSDEELTSIYSKSPQNYHANYLSWNPTVGRNSTFVALTDDQKEELGGVEYRSLKLLIVLLTSYYVGFHLMILVFYLPFGITNNHYAGIIREDGVSPTWWGFFTAASVFNDLGLTLTPDSMISFSQNAYILIIACFFIVIGNTGFPIFLRLIIWVMRLFTRPLTLMHESLSFLLDHPRRCFTLLFPSGPTWWLFAVLVLLNGIDWILFIILDFNNASLADTPKGYRVLDGLFQAFTTRTAGFACVNLAALHPAIQVSYLIMMYISVMPLAISIRRTNVYEEQALGVYFDADNDQDQDQESVDSNNSNNKKKKKNFNFIGTHLRKQLSFDLWFIFLALFFICICETHRLDNEDPNFSTFQILFEIVSAYGTVGLSMGYPNKDTSFAGELTVLSKLIVIAAMIRGRHRGLPYSIDRAIMWNTDKVKIRDAIQMNQTIARTQTLPSVDSNANAGYRPYGPLLRVNTTIDPSYNKFSDLARKVSHVATNWGQNFTRNDTFYSRVAPDQQINHHGRSRSVGQIPTTEVPAINIRHNSVDDAIYGERNRNVPIIKPQDEFDHYYHEGDGIVTRSRTETSILSDTEGVRSFHDLELSDIGEAPSIPLPKEETESPAPESGTSTEPEQVRSPRIKFETPVKPPHTHTRNYSR